MEILIVKKNTFVIWVRIAILLIAFSVIFFVVKENKKENLFLVFSAFVLLLYVMKYSPFLTFRKLGTLQLKKDRFVRTLYVLGDKNLEHQDEIMLSDILNLEIIEKGNFIEILIQRKSHEYMKPFLIYNSDLVILSKN